MTIKNLTNLLQGKELYVEEPDRIIESGYAGDLLSFVMGRAPSGCAWFTVMTNINICAVAVLADIAVIVVCEGCEVDENVIAKARQQGINIISTELDIFGAIKKIDAGQI